MSLFNVAAIVLLLATMGTTGVKHYERGLYSINVQVSNGWFHNKWWLLVPKNVARYDDNVMVYNVRANAVKGLGKTDFKPTLRALQWRITTAEMDNRLDQKSWLQLLRRWNERPHTEVGPGAFKDPLDSYDTRALGRQMKKLAALKKRQENQAKDLNEGRPS